MSNGADGDSVAELYSCAGEMRARVRDFDWAATPLGCSGEWPASLRHAVDIVLGCGFPAILVWGPQLIQIYNDAYVPLIGAKHPRALGLPTHACWPEIRDVQERYFARVFRGEAVQLSEAQYSLDRFDSGELEDAWFDATFIPVPLGTGEIGGSLSILFESSDRVRARAYEADHEKLVRTAETAERAERESAAQLRVALEAASLGTWSYELGSEHAWNSARSNAVLGRPATPGPITFAEFLGCLEESDRPRVRAALDAALAGDGRYEVEYRVIRADGTTSWVAALGHMLPGADGAPARVMGIVQDVNERKAAEAERERLFQVELKAHAAVERAYGDVAAANRAKSEFLAVMSHELRTPLNAIGGYVELIELGIRGPVTQEQLVDLQRIKASQRHLMGLVTDVLHLVRIETGRLEYALHPVAIAEIVSSVEVLIGPQLLAKEVFLDPARSDSSLFVQADREKLIQILVNLLTNALKFTGPGGRIGMECVADDSTVTIHVRDTGIGIAPEKLHAIFEPFVQVDQRPTRTNDGVGLGLAISRDLARGMGAELSVESTPGVGSTFMLTLPRVQRD
ncbi:MAG: ATP-binding protein [Gemmatimonadota bacterium]